MKLNTMIKTLIVAALSGLCVVTSIQAQNDPTGDKNAAPQTADLPVFDIDFPGGTPAELVQQLAKASGKRPNVIIPQYVADFRIPQFKLQNVNTPQVFDALNMVTDEKGTLSARWISEGAKGDRSRVWTLMKAPAKPSTETCQVTFIGNLLEFYSLEDVNAAIRTAWDLLGNSPKASLMFHKETKLLIAKGNEEQLKLAFEVLKSLDQGTAGKKADRKSVV